MSRNEKIVQACLQAWHQAGKGTMLTGISGGADSTALLLACHKAKIPVHAAHCNFQLRGEEALRDENFVKTLCSEMGIQCHIIRFDVKGSALKGESTEMTCRRLRYDYFRRLKEKEGFSRILIAHNADDNEETFFLNALRGAGSRGLKGMEPDSGEILRPLLVFSRSEILNFLLSNNQSHIVDSSNLESDHYRRNYLRNKIFPMLEERWEGFHKAIAATIDIQRRENKIVEHFTGLALNDVSDLLPWTTVRNFPDFETLIYRFIKPFGGTPLIAREMSGSAVKHQPGKEWSLGNGAKAYFTREGIKIIREEPTNIYNSIPDYKWETVRIDAINFDMIKASGLEELYVPYEPDRYEWKPADRNMKIKSLGLQASQRVWKVLKDAGISSAERNCFPVLCDKKSGEPIWLPGIKRSRLHLVSPADAIIFHLSR